MISTFALLLVASPLVVDLSLFVGAPPGPGDVVVLDTTGSVPPYVPPALSGIVLAPLDFTGRVAVDALREDRPRLVEMAGLPSWVQLPRGRGSLHRYQRGTTFGFFLVGPTGDAIPLLERPGTGANGGGDPFVGRVAISPDGSAFLVATSVAAGGDLLEVDLGTGGFEVRTANLSPRSFLPGSLALASDWGLALSEEGPLRFDRLPGAQARFPGIARRKGPNVTRFEDGVVVSEDGSTMAYVGIVREGVSYVQLLGRQGPIRAGCPRPGPISSPGFLPDATTGPHLALAPDGSCVAWRTEASTNEAWFAEAGGSTPNPPAAIQITSSQRFADTLGETGVIGFLSPSQLTLAVGEPKGVLGGGGVGSADVYLVDLPTGAVSNLSGTSGDFQAPFLLKGSLETSEGLWRVPSTPGMLAVDKSAGILRLLTMDPVSGSSVLLDSIKSLDTIEWAAGELVLSARRSVSGRPTDLFCTDPTPGSVPVRLARFAKGCRVRAVAVQPMTVNAVLECGVDRWLGRVDRSSLTTSVLTGQPQAFGTSIAVLPGGGLAATVTFAGGDVVVLWEATGIARVLYRSTTRVTLLPG